MTTSILGVCRRAERPSSSAYKSPPPFYCQQFNALAPRQKARRKLLHESQKHLAEQLLWQIPSIGRSAQLCSWL